MKICYDYQIFSSQKYGGISRYFYEIATRISTMEKFDVEILAPLYVNNYIKNCDALNIRHWFSLIHQLTLRYLKTIFIMLYMLIKIC